MFDDSKFIELIYADIKPEANNGLKFTGVVKINVQSLGKSERKGLNHEHNVYLHIKLSDGYVVVGKVDPFRQIVSKNNEEDDSKKEFHPLYFRFSHTSGGFRKPRMTEFNLIYEHIRVFQDKKIKDNYFLNYNGNHLKIPKRLGWINQIYGKDWHRTLIFVHRETAPGQSVHIIGARPTSKLHTSSQDVPIYHTNVKDKDKRFIREQDDLLSWVPLKKRLGSDYKNLPVGTPLDWTTDDPYCKTNWLNSGYGFDETNSELHLGPHYWLLDIIVDSSYCESIDDSDDESDYDYQDDLEDFDFDPYSSDHISSNYKESHNLRDKYEHLSNNKLTSYGYNENSEDGLGNTFKFKICDENGNIEGAYLNGGGGLTRVARCGMINIIEYGVPGSERYIPMDGIRRPIRDY